MEASTAAVPDWVLGVAVLTCGLGFIYWVWLRPRRLRQKSFSSNSYQLFFGNSEESTVMSEQVGYRPIKISNVIIPGVDPFEHHTVSKYANYSGKQSSSYQRTAKASYMDKQTGYHICTAANEVMSAGETVKERGSAGRVGTKDEYTTTKTLRVGDKRGYFEYEAQEKFRWVDYGNHSRGGRLCWPF
ncbi:hypothetical protein SLE2022_340900 [Rubroshorea leprosula]